MNTRLRLLLSLLLGALLVAPIACAKDPGEAGVALAKTHIALLDAGELTLARIAEDAEAAQKAYEGERFEAFRKGYQTTMKPHAGALVALAAKEAGALSRQAVAQAGAMLKGELSGTLEAIEAALNDDAMKGKMKALGKKLGSFTKKVGATLETVGQGFEEGMKEAGAE